MFPRSSLPTFGNLTDAVKNDGLITRVFLFPRPCPSVSSADIESKLAAVRDNAAAAWIDAEETQGRWSLAGCQEIIFFNYLIGATDAHAKNHSLLLVAPDDIRLAPLYNVASIAPYRPLAPSVRKPPRTALSIGGENRFGMLKKKHVEKMAVSCRLEELDIGADTLCEQFETMARMVPQVLASVIEEARLQKVLGIDDIAERMQTEISANCARFLS